jgi:hypothetical protein
LEAALFEQSNIILICKIWHFLNNFFLISQIRLQLREEEEETPLYTDKLQAHLVYIWRLEPFFSSKCGEFEGLH